MNPKLLSYWWAVGKVQHNSLKASLEILRLLPEYRSDRRVIAFWEDIQKLTFSSIVKELNSDELILQQVLPKRTDPFAKLHKTMLLALQALMHGCAQTLNINSNLHARKQKILSLYDQKKTQ